MLKIAHNISNLSDARYFAAYGFDWLLFNFGPGSEIHKHHIYGISEWISGSQIGILVHDLEELAFFLTNFPELKGFWINENLGYLSDMTSETTLFDNTNGHVYKNAFKIIHSLDEIIEPYDQMIFDLTNQDSSVIDLKSLPIAGVCLSGTEEEQPGRKSYSQMEEWIEVLEEM